MSVTIGNGVTSIGFRAFTYCDNLTSVYYDGDIASWCNIIFESSVSNPLYYAEEFYIKNSLGEYELVTDIIIPNTVTEIKDSAFFRYAEITSVTIPDSVTNIGYYAFYKCTGLTSVTIGDSITSIGEHAFDNCTGLNSINYRGTEEQWNAITKGSNWNYNVPSSCVITYNYTGE